MSQATTSQATAPDKYRILVIEDDPFIARLITANLNKMNLDHRVSANGIEGLKDFKEYDPHLVITDIMMPGMDGRAVCSTIREISMVPILMMTAADSSHAEMAAFKSGADDYIPKPFDPQLLTMRVMAHLRRVYRYDASIYQEPPEPQQPAAEAIPRGWMTCQTCGCKGERSQFARENARGQRFMLCPQCQESVHFLYG
jgi:DNA-binding response OmpR family regulator